MRSPGRSVARPPRTKSSKASRCRKCRIFPPTCRKQRPGLPNCRATRTDPDSNQGRYTMSDTYLAVFVGSKTSAKLAAWNALSEPERKAKEKEGIAAWKAWGEKHQRSEEHTSEL